MGNEPVRRVDSSPRFVEATQRNEPRRRLVEVAEASQTPRQPQKWRDTSPIPHSSQFASSFQLRSSQRLPSERGHSPSPVRYGHTSEQFYPRWELVADASEFANKALNLASLTKLNPNMTHLTPCLSTSQLPPKVRTAVLSRTLEFDVNTVLAVEEAKMKYDSPSVSAETPRTRTEGSPMMNYLVRARGGRALSSTPSPRSPATSYCEESPHFAGGGRGRGTPSSKGLDSSGGGRSDLCGPGHQLSFGAPILGGGVAPHLISFGAGAPVHSQLRNPSPHGFSFQGGAQSPSQASTPPTKQAGSKLHNGPQAVITEEEDEFDEPLKHRSSRSNSSSDSMRDVRELVSGSRGKRSIHKSSQGSQNEHRKEDSTTAGDYESARRQLLLKVGSSLQSKESVGSRGVPMEGKGVIQSMDARFKERDTHHQTGPGHQVFSAGLPADDKRRPARMMEPTQRQIQPNRQHHLEHSMGMPKLRDIGNIEQTQAFKDHMILRKSYTNTNVLYHAKENKTVEDTRPQVKMQPPAAGLKYSPKSTASPSWGTGNHPSSARAGYGTQNWPNQHSGPTHAPIRATHGLAGMPAPEPTRVQAALPSTPRHPETRAPSGSRDPPGNSRGRQAPGQGFSIRIDIGTLCTKLASQLPEFS